MSLSGHFSSKHVQSDKPKKDHITFEEDEKDEAVVKAKGKKVYKTFEEFPSKLLRHDDGTTAKYKGGKQVPGSHDGPKTKQVAKKDISSDQSRFYNPTPVSTIVETQRQGDKETAGEKDTASRVRKRFDVNNRALKL
jgi:hypothetical protein